MRENTDLKEVIDIIIKGKWIISIITFICVIFSGILSWVIMPEKYESKAIVQVASSVQDTGIMESFVATEFTPQIFSYRAKDEMAINEAFQQENLHNGYSQRNLIIDTENNALTLTYTSISPENAQKELQIIIETTKNRMNESVQDTLKKLENTYNKDAESLSNEIESLINEYNSIVRNNNLPEVLILQTILNPEMVINISDEHTKALANISGSIQNQLLQLQAQIQTKSEEFRDILADYQSVKTGLENFKPDPFIRIISEPTLPKSPSSPNHLLLLVIGFVSGIMIGLGVIFLQKILKEYSTN